ncbi:alpha/beta hydrolase [Nonomuraea sp. NPDC050790]|uniref:alpha/beta hydrolase n=1 Tax=Nonomuraea sp. NPDC050790 TaxID=3364371 RepID=UPI0037B2909B
MAVDEGTRLVIDVLTDVFPKIGTEVLDAAEARRILAQAPPMAAEPYPVGGVEDRMAGEIPVRVYRPEGEGPHPVVVYFHGGGFTLCTLDTHDGVCRTLCAGANAVVVSVDYRLAPEHPYPAAAEDAYAATMWAYEHAAELGGDAGRLAVAGDSAGGNLAAVTCLKARDAGGSPPISFQLLVYPVTDAAMDTPSHQENGEGYFLTNAHMRWYWDNYQPDPARRGEPYCSPIRADTHGLPPALVITAEHDPLRDEGEAYAGKLRAAGGAARTLRFEGMFHGFFGLDAFLPAAKSASEQACAALRDGLGQR